MYADADKRFNPGDIFDQIITDVLKAHILQFPVQNGGFQSENFRFIYNYSSVGSLFFISSCWIRSYCLIRLQYAFICAHTGNIGTK